MSKNRGVVYTRPGEVQVQDIADPKFENPQGRKIEHGVILKVVSTNICGSDQHMVRGRTSAPPGMVLGHEIMDLTMLTDILPTGFHGALNAGVKPGSTVYVAGAGPVGLAAAASAQLLGAAVVMIGDMNEARLSHARDVGFVPIDLSKHDRL